VKKQPTAAKKQLEAKLEKLRVLATEESKAVAGGQAIDANATTGCPVYSSPA